MYQVGVSTSMDYEVCGLVSNKLCGCVEAYEGDVIKNTIFVQFRKYSSASNDSTINVLPKNIDNLIGEIKNCESKIDTPHGDYINLNDISTGKQEIIEDLKNINYIVENAPYINISVENTILVGDFIEKITLTNESSRCSVFIFGNISIEKNLIMDENFDFNDHIEKGLICECQYCQEEGKSPGYLIKDSNSEDSMLCNNCAREIKEKCDKISTNESIIKEIVVGDL